jgi:hypothetical protein
VHLGIHACGEEALELGAAAVDYTERRVSRTTRELGRCLDEPLQERIEGQTPR